MNYALHGVQGIYLTKIYERMQSMSEVNHTCSIRGWMVERHSSDLNQKCIKHFNPSCLFVSHITEYL